MADAVGGERQTGRHPVREKAEVLGSEIPEVHVGRNREVLIDKGREGERQRERRCSGS